MDKIALRMMRCPVCESKHIDEFEYPYWFMRRDCGHRSDVFADETEAINDFLGTGYITKIDD